MFISIAKIFKNWWNQSRWFFGTRTFQLFRFQGSAFLKHNISKSWVCVISYANLRDLSHSRIKHLVLKRCLTFPLSLRIIKMKTARFVLESDIFNRLMKHEVLCICTEFLASIVFLMALIGAQRPVPPVDPKPEFSMMPLKLEPVSAGNSITNHPTDFKTSVEEQVWSPSKSNIRLFKLKDIYHFHFPRRVCLKLGTC